GSEPASQRPTRLCSNEPSLPNLHAAPALASAPDPDPGTLPFAAAEKQLSLSVLFLSPHSFSLAGWNRERPYTMADFSKESCPSVKNILLLDSEGKRVAVKYFSDDWPTNASKLAYEKSVFTKTLKTNARTEAEITLFDGYIVVYKFVHDLHFFVTAGDDENELILASVLHGFSDSVGLLLRGDVEKRTALENLDLILLCIDEIVDGGIILETDANTIAGKVATNAVDGSVPFSEQ
ncbi:hypothetical protein ACJX0J_031630, partial [Zea mays]